MTITGKSTQAAILSASYQEICDFYNEEANATKFPRTYSSVEKMIDWHHASQDAALYRAESNFGC